MQIIRKTRKMIGSGKHPKKEAKILKKYFFPFLNIYESL